MAAQHIDVWDSKTFDSALRGTLEGHADLIKDYLQTHQEIFLAHDLGRGPRQSILRPDNPFAAEYHALEEAVGQEMEHRTIRAFHYTRMTENEVATLMRDGIHLSTTNTLRSRLDNLVKAGVLTSESAERLYTESPFHSDQLKSRSNKFWFASHPVAIDDSGVVPLVAHWGGEVASMWVRDDALLKLLATVGKARIVEVAVPMSATRHSYAAGKAVVATFARSLGSISEKAAFDLYAKQPLSSSAILAVHTDSDAKFLEMGRTYPAGFVDVSIGYWKELTGED